MRHDPEALAAAYVAGPQGMPPGEVERFEAHLLSCEACWAEVTLAREGRLLAESLRTVAAPDLRDRLRMTVAARRADDDAPQRSALGLRGRPVRTTAGPRFAVAVAVVLLVAGGVGLVGPSLLARAGSEAVDAGPGAAGSAVSAADGVTRPGDAARPGDAVGAALAGFRAGRLPGTDVPADAAPDLGALGFTLVAAASGRLGPSDAVMFAYRSGTGQRLAVYRSSTPFVDDDRAPDSQDTEAAWTLHDGDVVVLCGPASHTTLLLGTDAGLVRQAGALLKLT